ncbi:PIN domain-containing protein [Sinomonas sp. ASV322]|uniref:PIN domain-containing protein n=1 Tax=Sinomonas sp. ASV322 TaxID=3041920 RepID=UPI0027DC19C8|nr:PIN domain-containing protein [Sinomonas sp. ASV322]MDQ4503866.1 PIN domain-containing protein [Sinomonas sp. ASV322]
MDTSAALKLIVEERESAALAESIDSAEAVLVACRLLETEMRRAAQRDPSIHQDLVSTFLEGVDLYEMPASLFRQAGLLPGASLRSLDALHLAAAVALDVDAIATYDIRLGDAALELGIDVVRPAV